MLIARTKKSIDENKFTQVEYIENDLFFFNDEENEYFLKEIERKIDINFNDLYYLLDTYNKYINLFIDLYLDYKDILIKIKEKFSGILNNIKIKSNILLPEVNQYEKIKLPNAWFITPNGKLYNTGGEQGHKQGNLIYPYFYIILPFLRKDKCVPLIDNREHIKEIEERGYVTADEFQNYANKVSKVPTIITSEIINDEERWKKLLKMSEEEYKKIPYNKIPHTERSYQKNIITLVKGHLEAESSLYKSFCKLNNSHNKKDNVNKIDKLTNSFIPDILVEYCGFHKVESRSNKTITSSDLNAIDEFKLYLDKGWNLEIIPRIIYDSYLDRVEQIDLNSYYMQKHLDEKLNGYNGKGKILIKK